MAWMASNLPIKETKMSDIMSKEQFIQKMKKLTHIPEGFILTQEEETFGYSVNSEKWLVFVLKSDTIEMRFSQTGSGTTNFRKSDGAWLTFDRRGVEASFYHQPLWKGDKVKSLNAIVKEQIQRVAERLKYYETALEVPTIPFTISPSRKEDLIKQLRTRGSISFMPSGFGTGYTITTRWVRDSRPANKKLEAFFGVGSLYVSTFDAD
jgi:hypothetical protein